METVSTAQDQKIPVTILGFFDDEKSCEDAYKILTELEYPPVSITMAMAEKTYQEKYQSPAITDEPPATDAQGGSEIGKEDDTFPKSTKAPEGFALGSAAGATIGAVALLGASLVFPGVMILGPLAATVTGVGVGGTVGGLTGLLFGSGHPENEVRNYEELISNGKYVIRVSPKSVEDTNIISRDWKSLGGDVEIHY
jgi:hypothetical protein